MRTSGLPAYNPYQDPGYPYGAPRPPAYPEPASRTMAGWALGLAIVGCLCITALVAIGLAIAVLVKSRDGRDHGKGMAIAALVIAPIWIVTSIVVNVVGVIDELAADAERDDAGRVTERTTISVAKIRAGDCLNSAELAGAGDETVHTSEVEVVPCLEPHQLEAYLVGTLPEGEYPGSQKVQRTAGRMCLLAFDDFVGLSYGRSELDFVYLYPEAPSWRTIDDRDITCLVTDPQDPTTGSLRGSRR